MPLVFPSFIEVIPTVLDGFSQPVLPLDGGNTISIGVEFYVVFCLNGPAGKLPKLFLTLSVGAFGGAWVFSANKCILWLIWLFLGFCLRWESVFAGSCLSTSCF